MAKHVLSDVKGIILGWICCCVVSDIFDKNIIGPPTTYRFEGLSGLIWTRIERKQSSWRISYRQRQIFNNTIPLEEHGRGVEGGKGILG